MEEASPETVEEPGGATAGERNQREKGWEGTNLAHEASREVHERKSTSILWQSSMLVC